jgi:hypothetical protein
MPPTDPLSRRRLLQQFLVGVPLAAALAATARAADAPLLAVDSAEAKAVGYVEDARSAKEAQGNSCASCGLYQGAAGSAQGACSLFTGRAVKAAGWCRSWSPQM